MIHFQWIFSVFFFHFVRGAFPFKIILNWKSEIFSNNTWKRFKYKVLFECKFGFSTKQVFLKCWSTICFFFQKALFSKTHFTITHHILNILEQKSDPYFKNPPFSDKNNYKMGIFSVCFFWKFLNEPTTFPPTPDRSENSF